LQGGDRNTGAATSRKTFLYANRKLTPVKSASNPKAKVKAAAKMPTRR
jgi:hypothetical protein